MPNIIDEGEQDTLHIKVTNNLTGEISEVKVTNAEEAKNLLLQLNASRTTIGKATDGLKNYLDRFLGNDERYDFADGKILRRVQRQMMTYRVESLRKHLDADQIDVCLKVDKTATDALIKEMVERGEVPPNTLKLIREEADVKAQAAFVEVK